MVDLTATLANNVRCRWVSSFARGTVYHRGAVRLLLFALEIDRQQNIAIWQIEPLDRPSAGALELDRIGHIERGPRRPGASLRVVHGIRGLAVAVLDHLVAAIADRLAGSQQLARAGVPLRREIARGHDNAVRLIAPPQLLGVLARA